MKPNEVLKFSKRDVILESFLEGKEYAAKIKDDEASFNTLQKEVDRKIRNLRRSKYIKKHGSDALDTLSKRVPVKGNKAKINRRDVNAVTSALMFVNAKTSTAKGKIEVDSARAKAFKATILRYLEDIDVFTDEEKQQLRETLEAMTSEELAAFADVYSDAVLGQKDYDSNQKMITIATHALDVIVSLRNQSLYNMKRSISSKTAKKDFDSAVREAQDEGFVIAQSSADDFLAEVLPKVYERRDLKEAKSVVRKAHKSNTYDKDYIDAYNLIKENKEKREAKRAAEKERQWNTAYENKVDRDIERYIAKTEKQYNREYDAAVSKAKKQVINGIKHGFGDTAYNANNFLKQENVDDSWLNELDDKARERRAAYEVKHPKPDKPKSKKAKKKTNKQRGK